MKFILSIHPLLQSIAILLAMYAGYLGYQRTRSLHFGHTVPFQRDRHALTGAISLISMLGGLAGGLIIASRFLEKYHGHPLHKEVAFMMLPLLVIGIFTGFYLYMDPKKRVVLPAIHGINNLILLAFALFQLFSGMEMFLGHVLGE